MRERKPETHLLNPTAMQNPEDLCRVFIEVDWRNLTLRGEWSVIFNDKQNCKKEKQEIAAPH